MSTNFDGNRQVHATSVTGLELVRYDREGRWFTETTAPGANHRLRHSTIHEAVEAALLIEAAGGTIHFGQPGGKRFDSIIAAAKQKEAR